MAFLNELHVLHGRRIQRAAVLGAGVMGAQIAAHLANAGVPVILFDVTEEAAKAGADGLLKMSPAPLFVPENRSLISTASLQDIDSVSKVDWVVEAIVEDLEIKQELMARVEAIRAPHAIVSSNTSGIPIAEIAEGRGEEFRKHFLGTHFFNPPRYLRLVEIIPTPATDPLVIAGITEFLERRLGKAVVPAPDTPAFIANHIGIVGVVKLLDALATGKYTIEEIDAITGPASGRPKSATFRTLDLAGVDILSKVAGDLRLEVPGFLSSMVQKGLLGDKTGSGFYKKTKTAEGTKILTLDINTFEYREPQKVKIPSLDAAKGIESLPERLRMLVAAEDKAGDCFARR